MLLISKFNNENIEKEMMVFEEKFQINLSDEYKNFLRKYNGGLTPKTTFRINRVSSDIKGFYGFGNAKNEYNFNEIQSEFFFDEILEDGYLPIAHNSWGDNILLGVSNVNEGEIYFYCHDDEKGYIKLADDILQFMQKCKSKRIGHIETVEERKELLIKHGNAENITDDLIETWQEEIDRYANIHQEKVVLDEE